MKRYLPCLLAALLFLPGCAKEGNYYINGQYVHSSSGRDYVICETDYDGVWYVRVEDASETNNLLTDVENGSFVSMQCAPRIEESEISHYTPIYSCEIKRRWVSKEIPAEHQAEIDRIDTLYRESEEVNE